MKNRNISGFTLVELMIAIVLFCTLSILTYNFMKSSMESTLRQKTQQMVNENTKNLLKMIVDDLKSSTVLNFKKPINGGNLYSYPSSVIYPATNQFSSTGGNDRTEHQIGLSEDGLDTIRHNRNFILFYSKNIMTDADNDDWLLQIIGYRTRVNTAVGGGGICRVERIAYDNNLVGLGEWPGLTFIAGVANNSIDQCNVVYNPLGNPTHVESVMTLPNRGDIALIYVNRGIDETFGGNPRFAANQYNVKVMVFQTIKRAQGGNQDDMFSEEGVPDNTFISIFNGVENNPNNRGRNNYRYAEMSSSVFVESSFLNR